MPTTGIYECWRGLHSWLDDHHWSQLWYLLLSVLLVVMHGGMLHQTMDHPNASPDSTDVTIGSIFGSLQALLMLTSLAHISLTWRQIGIGTSWIIYLATIFSFLGVYLYLNLLDQSMTSVAFFKESYSGKKNGSNADALLKLSEDSAISVVTLFLYFSVATQTGVGFGDITAKHPISQLICCCQMLFGMLYSLIIVSQTVEKIAFESSRAYSPRNTGMSQIWHRMGAKNCVKRARRFARDHILLVTTGMQLITYTMLVVVGGGDEFAIRTHTTDGHGHRTSSSRVNWGVARPEVISLLIQLLNVLVVIIVAFKYVRKTAMVNVGFLIQSFVATTLAFAGMHVTIFLLDDAREAYWVPCKIAADSRCNAVHGDGQADTEFWGIVADFCYFSLSIMTTTGYGDMFARSVIARFIVTIQMLVAVLFSVVVVALGLRKLNTPIVSTELTQHMLDTPVTLRAQELEESEKLEQQAQLVQHDQGDSPHARMSTSTRTSTSTSTSNNKLNNSTSSDEANPC